MPFWICWFTIRELNSILGYLRQPGGTHSHQCELSSAAKATMHGLNVHSIGRTLLHQPKVLSSHPLRCWTVGHPKLRCNVLEEGIRGPSW